MTESQPQDGATGDAAAEVAASSEPSAGSSSQLAGLSLAELETEIAQAESLVQDLNQRLQQTADDRG